MPSLDRPTTGHRDDFVSEKPPSAVMAAAPMALGGGVFFARRRPQARKWLPRRGLLPRGL